jgi:RNA polymerase sigma-70 factor (ECF subfamily)
LLVNSQINGVDLDRDEAFLERLRSGDREAFSTLVDMNQDMVYNLTLKMVRDRELAEDLSQEVFIKVYRALPSFGGRSRLSTWIYRIAYNVSVTELQKARHRYERTDIDEPAGEETPGMVQVSGAVDPHEELERSEMMRRVAELIEKLKPQQRLAILLYYQGERSYEEISEVMKLPMGTVKTLLFRAKEALRDLCRAEGEI